MSFPRLAVRAVLVHENRLLLVNAYASESSTLWCAPGGGVERGSSLPDNLKREVYEETGLRIAVGDPCLINEFHDVASRFHQVEVFFRCSWAGGHQDPNWRDPENVVSRRRWVNEDELRALRVKPSSLADVAFGKGLVYDPLEPIAR